MVLVFSPETFALISREGKLDVLKELCLEHKDGDYIHTALKSKDKFGQTPMLSSISASENRNEILKFLLNLILERSSDTALQEVENSVQERHSYFTPLFQVAILAQNKHHDSILTLLMKNHEVFRETRQLFFKIFM